MKHLTNRYFIRLIGVLTLLFSGLSLAALSPVEKHGALSINQGTIVNKNLVPVSLAGPSLFWSWDKAEGEAFYNSDVVNHITHQWNASIIRAAMAAQGKGSYLDSPINNKLKVETVVDAAISNGIYIIIDWHSHAAEKNVDQAVDFFQHMARKYGHTPNVIYEIYNEPLNTTDWDTVIKPYAEEVITAIRAIDKDNIIIVGTQTWSQDVDKVVKNPIKLSTNLAYALHFYAGSHKEKLRQKAQIALDAGLALFVSEWGAVNANGDGEIDKQSVNEWLRFMKMNNLSHCSWSITDKDEGSAMLKPFTLSTPKTHKDWSHDDLTPNGRFMKNIIKNWGD